MATICAPTVRPCRFRIDRPRAAGRGIERQLDFDARRVLDHVSVGHDVAVGIDDDAGAAAAFELRFYRGALIVFVGRRISGHEDLHDARADLRGEFLQRSRQLREWR